MARLIASANLPYCIVENEELQDLCQWCVEVGAKKGTVRVKNISNRRKSFFCSRNTQRSHNIKLECDMRKELINDLKCIMEQSITPAASFTLDLWTDNTAKKNDYLGITIRFLDLQGSG